MSKKSILFVCLGNICRSPAAEAVFTNLVKKRDRLDEFHIDSAATCNHHIGEKADKRMREAALNRGIEITSRGRQFQVQDFKDFDYIIVMDNSNLENVLALATSKEDEARVSKLTDYLTRFTEYDHVPDPYYGGAQGFELVLDLLENGCANLLNKL